MRTFIGLLFCFLIGCGDGKEYADPAASGGGCVQCVSTPNFWGEPTITCYESSGFGCSF